MELQLHCFPVEGLAWSDSFSYDSFHLKLNKQSLYEYLAKNGLLHDVDIHDFHLIAPNTSVRIVNIFDVFPAYARIGEKAVNYPGVLGPIEQVGNGISATLENFAILALSSLQTDRNNKILDMSGHGARITPYSKLFHLAFEAAPKNDNVKLEQYYLSLKKIGLALGSHIAKLVYQLTAAQFVRTFTLRDKKGNLPKAAYIFMISSHQKSSELEPVLYGDNVGGLLPTVVHPNEILDGAVIAPFWNLGIDTYSFQKHPIILQLYEKHGVDLEIAGVIVCTAHVTREKRTRNAQMATTIAAQILQADITILTKLGGGIPESDVMMMIDLLEQQNVTTAAAIWSTMGDGTIEDSLSAYAKAADALVSVGIWDEVIELSPQEKVIGGTAPILLNAELNNTGKQINDSLNMYYRTISGAISQLGASYVGLIEV